MSLKPNFLKTLIQNHESFVITTHKSCDGDGLGAGVALLHALQAQGKETSFITLDPPPERYAFLNENKLIKEYSPSLIKKDQILLAVDVNDTSLIEPLYSKFKNHFKKIYFIDHHPIIEKKENCEYLIDTQASSTGEIMHALISEAGWAMDKNIATALYTSIVFDTKCFRSIKNSSLPFKISAELIPHIPDVERIYSHIFKRLTKKNLYLYSYLNQVEFHCKDRLALLHLKETQLKELGSDIGQACDLLDKTMTVKSVEMAVLIVEKEQEGFKLSLRSQSQSLLPFVNSIGGGGHKKSAGAYVQDISLQELKKKIISDLGACL